MSKKFFDSVHNICINNKYTISVSRFLKNANFLYSKKVLKNLTKMGIESIIR